MLRRPARAPLRTYVILEPLTFVSYATGLESSMKSRVDPSPIVSNPGSARLDALRLPRCAAGGMAALAVGVLDAGAAAAGGAPSAGLAADAAGAASAVCARDTAGTRTMAPASALARRWKGMLESRARRVRGLQF